MEEILARQRNAAKQLNGRSFLLGVAAIIVRLALAQIIVNLLIMATGIGLLNILFYLYAILVLVSFMRRTVAGCVYMLKPKTLVLQKTLGDSTTSVVEIPLESIVSIRPVMAGDRMHSSYRSVTVIDHTVSVPMRVKLAFGVSVFSARWARKLAGNEIYRQIGYIAAFKEEDRRVAVVFKPNEEFCAALHQALPGIWGVDERTRENTPITMLGRALERAFPEIYPFIDPLVDPQKAKDAIEEVECQKRKKNPLFDKKRKEDGSKKLAPKGDDDEV